MKLGKGMEKKIRKAIIPAAGLGNRFLATKVADSLGSTLNDQ